MRQANWNKLIKSIERHRSGAALFFKPVCVIAAIDLADEGRINPNDIDANSVILRFSDYITPSYSERGKDGYQPLWRLANDRLWTFFEKGKALNSKVFPSGSPGTHAKLFAKFDRLAINEDLMELWTSSLGRRALRDSMLLMLNDSDADGRRLIEPLFDAKHYLDRTRWPSDAVLQVYMKNLRDQRSLFDDEISSRPECVENIPTPIEFEWSDGIIVVGPNSASLPVFPNTSTVKNHTSCLDACHTLANELLSDLNGQKFQVREDYKLELQRYIARLPTNMDAGSILLADAAARTLREMFLADQTDLSPTFAARLKVVLQQHLGLRPFYPEIEHFYQAVKTGRIDDPLPLDAVSEVINVVRRQTPTVFSESVSIAVAQATAPSPQVITGQSEVVANNVISPPPDPLGELDARKARDFQTAGWINRLWKVFKLGETVNKSARAWIDTYIALAVPIAVVISWLRSFRGP